MSSLFKHSIFNLSSQLVIFLTAIFTSTLLARYFGPSLMGQYSFLIWLVSVLALIATLGLPLTLIKFIAHFAASHQEAKIKQLITQTLIWEIIISIILTVGLIILNLIFQFEGEKIIYFLIALSLPPLVLTATINGSLQGLQKYQDLLKANLLISPLNLLLVFLIIFFKGQFIDILLINLVVVSLNLVILFYFLRNYLDFKVPKIPTTLWKEISSYTITVSAIVFLDFIIWQKSEVFFLKAFSSIEEVGYYSLSYSLISKVMIVIPGAIAGVIMPRVAHHFGQNNNEGVSNTYFISTRYLLLVTLPIIFGGIALASPMVILLFGDSYLSMIPITKILLVSSGMAAIIASASAVAYGTGNQRFILKTALVVAVVNIFLDLLLISPFGAIGAALSNASAQILGVLIGAYFVVYIKKLSFPWPDAIKIFVSTLIPFLIIHFLQIFWILTALNQMIIFGSIFGLIYLFCLVIAGFFTQQDLRLLYSLGKKRR